MTQEDNGDALRELFGDPIFSYTDQDAIRDGVLIPLVIGGTDTGHRVTATSFSELKAHYERQGCGYNDEDLMAFFFREMLPLVPTAFREYETGGILTTDYDFGVRRTAKGRVLWYLPNERGGITMMLPGDY